MYSKLVAWAGITLFVVGAVAFVAGGVVALAGSRLSLLSVEFPLGDVQDIAVDGEGNILLALGFYGRIQLYDKHGRFLRGWSAESGGGPLTASFRTPDQVASYARRRDSTLLFDLTGRRVHSESKPSSSEQSASEHKRGTLLTVAPDGSVLWVRHRFLWPTVVRQTDGVMTLAITGPWFMRPLCGPLPTWLLMLVGGLLSKLGSGRSRRKERHHLEDTQ